MPRIHWSVAPYEATPTQRKNFAKVQYDGMGVALANAAIPFLPVFLARLGASNFQVSLLTTMPAVTGLVLALSVGRFLQSRRNIVPWFASSRLLAVGAYAATGLAGFIVPQQYLVVTVLVIWALATLPQTAVDVCFWLVMSEVAGPTMRYDLMSRRWSIMGFITAFTTAIAGVALNRTVFPVNFQVLFIGLSVGGLVSYFFTSRVKLPDVEPVRVEPGRSFKQNARHYSSLMSENPKFVHFSVKRFVFLTGAALAAPLLPLYYVRVVQANNAWIGLISTAQTAFLLVGYFVWTRQTRRRGSHYVLVWTALGLSLYPALVGMTTNVYWITILGGLAGIFQAGIDLVLFDELMKTVPLQFSATFVAIAMSVTYLSSVLAPTMSTLLANALGLSGALYVSSAVKLAGFGLFAFWNPDKARVKQKEPEGIEDL